MDYKQLNEIGEKVEKEEVKSNQIEGVSNLFRTISISKDLQSLNVEESMDKQRADALVIDEATTTEDIDDYIDENNVENVLSIEEVDEKIQRIAELRTAYRKKHNELKVLLGSNYEESYAEDAKKRLTSVKHYIMKANMVKRDKSERKRIPDTKSIASKKRSEEFLVQEVKATMRNLHSTLKTDVKHLNDDEVKERKSGLLKLIKRIENLPKMVHNLLECSNSVAKDEVDEIMTNYSNISILNEKYFKDINNEVKNSEITKQKLFNESKLRINLPQFSGYELKLDIYSFHSEFLKIYEQITPKRMMPDLLKNNL